MYLPPLECLSASGGVSWPSFRCFSYAQAHSGFGVVFLRAFVVTYGKPNVVKVCNYHQKSRFLSFYKTVASGRFSVPFLGAFCGRLRLWGPPGPHIGSFGVPGSSFEVLGDGILRSCVCLDTCQSLSRFLYGARGVRKSVLARFLVDVWGCSPATLDSVSMSLRA